MSGIEKVAVIGAGVMGAGIAAHVANAGVPVLLFDIVPEGARDRSLVAKGALDALQKAKPPAFMQGSAAKRVVPCNIEDDLPALAECDWIIEAVTERLDVKHAIYAKIDAHRKTGSIVSSNTSTIPLSVLTGGLGEAFAADFVVTHFFNPPRYMPLLELVASSQTRPTAIDSVRDFCDHRLGKGVVRCNDRPGFIGNRLGVYWGLSAINAAIDLGLTVEEADAVMGRPLGIPKTGIFGMADLVGLDLMPLVAKSLGNALPPEDSFHALLRPQPIMEQLVAAGYTGRKGKGGFYRLNRAAGNRKEAVDLQTGEYRPAMRVDIPILKHARVTPLALIDDDSKYGRFARRVLGETLSYAACLVGDAADSVEAIDEAMRLGYDWERGPFELIDRIGITAFVARLKADGLAVPELLKVAGARPFYDASGGRRQVLQSSGGYTDMVRPDGVLLLDDVKRTSPPVIGGESAALWDIGDGVACFEITTRMNTLDGQVLAQLEASLERADKDFDALVIYSDGPHFSAGANLAQLAGALDNADAIANIVAYGQHVMTRLRDSDILIVAAPAGLALGGGCELALHANAIQAHAECYMGLVEVGVGLIPGWGGCKELLWRLSTAKAMPRGPMPAAMKAFETISTAKVSGSAAEAREMGFLRPGDGITMNRRRLLTDAKTKAREMVTRRVPSEPPRFQLPGLSGETLLVSSAEAMARMGLATDHDVTICARLAHVLTGGGANLIEVLDEARLLELEREAFIGLLAEPKSRERIAHMLESGKPLRN
ncbi:3-hydroxyacyl-CoA dehydrogenase/enoyl-CoA hydratase family protein [Rhabdaerophilum sp. SD176]|uniref:3-hydroxyacyl-CoA dehydrogenase/enoyl-CoA hydratase family protein n=1 Tax=Rhabdaerophilum sp. SD176 TaxID=2983548 RepID=UPI0024DFC46F|nr:3-hydroxyacyl-CoA dehydrogenase/enoyl-CoA hydratase family protein [Rhabdaerophilum sp. SD176]